MRDRIQKILSILRHIGSKTLTVALVVFVFAAGIAVYTGIRLSATEKAVLQNQGKLNAKKAAVEYDRCLLTRVNIITLIGRNVDNMLRSGTADNTVIKAYLKEQTDCITATLDPSTTGLYGWINGEYLDGSDWVPGADYHPTERPWYLQTVASKQEITFVEPYLDMQTQTIMMTVSELMSDGVSVLAMDVSLDPIQKIVEEVSSATEGSQALVLDTGGIVVAHSDRNELGKNYLTAAGAPGGEVAEKIFTGGQMQFDLTADSGNYSVYVDRLEGGWYSVSMINSDVWYRPLRRAMVIFCAVIALVGFFLVSVFLHMNAKNLALQRLHTRIHQEEKRGEELLALSETDRMTGLLDRVNGARRVDELLKSGNSGMFLEVDVDEFKMINDTCGHQTGDLVIHALADALRAAFRSNDIIMRLGGDEFCVYAVGIVDQGMGTVIIRRIFERLDDLQIQGYPYGKIHVSVGAVIHTETERTTFADLYACADRAMYSSKKTAGNSLTFGIPGKRSGS